MKYGMIRVASSVISSKVADCDYNTKEIENIILQAQKQNVKILLFSELSISGYACGDLFFNTTLQNSVSRNLEQILKFTKDIDILIAVGMPLKIREKIFNTAVLIHKSKILAIVPKTYIPKNNEYYENRWFSSAEEREDDEVELYGEKVPFGNNLIVKDKNYNDICIGVELCEDLWGPLPPSSFMAVNGAMIILNLSASNENIGKYEMRKSLISNQSMKCKCAYIYASCGNGESTTDHVYGGYSSIAENGKILVEGERFLDDSNLIVSDIDLELLRKERSKSVSFLHKPNYISAIPYRTVEFEFKNCNNDIYRNISSDPFGDEENRKEICKEALLLQREAIIKKIKYVKRNKVIIGISGGLDSTLALGVCVEAYKKMNIDTRNIIGVTMPGPGTTNRTHSNALKLMKLFNITALDIDINDTVKNHLKKINHPNNIFDITFEQTQSRERTKILMDLANKENGIVIGTGDMSELALGWMSYNGDQMSMYALNSGVPKSMVRYMVEYILNDANKELAQILNDILNTPISPELLPVDNNGNQKQETEDLIGPYKIHDFYLYYFTCYGFDVVKIIEMAETAFKNEYSKDMLIKWMKTFLLRFFTRQFKRTCFPDGPQIWKLSLSPRGFWRMPSDAEYNIWMQELDSIKKGDSKI